MHRRSFTSLVVAAAFVSAPCALLAEDAPPAGDSATTAPAERKKTGLDQFPTLKPEYKQMETDLKFNDEQKTKMQAAYVAKGQALLDWDTKNKPKLMELKRKLTNAKSVDKDGIKADIEFMEDERKELDTKTDRDVLDALSPEQKEAWTASSLYRHASRFYARVQLKEDQKKQIQAQAEKSSKGLDLADEKSFRAASKEVRTYAERVVFTDQQKDMWRKSKATDRARQEDNSDEPDPSPDDNADTKKDKVETKTDNTKPKSGFLDQAAADNKKPKQAPPAPKQQQPAKKQEQPPANKSPFGKPIGKPIN